MLVSMEKRERLYASVLRSHLGSERQMAFVAGPRQVGKTHTCQSIADTYLDWDDDDHRDVILQGPAAVARYASAQILSTRRRIVVLDELHKYGHWKRFLKGLFDTWQERLQFVVTGSSRLDVYRRGGDSLMGRYFLFHMHPFSVAELLRTETPSAPIRPPAPCDEGELKALVEHGGFPEPFLRRDARFTRRWRNLRSGQLLREDVRDLTRVQEIGQLAKLAQLLEQRSGEQLVARSLAREVRVSENTVRAWIEILTSLYHGFIVRPWFRNVARALRKEPKWYLRDWAALQDEGKRAETLVACHLLKAVEGWTDLGLGTFELRYIRDKEKREADFLVVRDGNPWFLAEVKLSDTSLSPSLDLFQRQTRARHAFQLVMGADYVDHDCFTHSAPIVVPARTFLSQLL